MRAKVLVVCLLGFLIGFAPIGAKANTKPCVTRTYLCAKAKAPKIPENPPPPKTSTPKPSGTGNPGPKPVSNDPFEYKVQLACGSRRSSSAEGSDDSQCRYGLTACQFRTPPSDEVMYYVWRRPKDGSTEWIYQGENCGLSGLPPSAPAPPPVPTLGQIQEAFQALPFAKPQVNIQPEGDVTLVNLPTYFEARWPTADLAPGDVSSKVQLLSWSVEFKIAPAAYNYDFGDGETSGRTTDTGGPYPEGNIRHTYAQPMEAASVKVDAELTGWFRVNGGTWQDLGASADLVDEPVVTLQVREAKARLYNNGG